jgi:hypothetical protein
MARKGYGPLNPHILPGALMPAVAERAQQDYVFTDVLTAGAEDFLYSAPRTGTLLQAALRPAIFVHTFIKKVNTFMGRPPGRIQDRAFQMRVSDSFLRAIDKWRAKQEDKPSRAEAIRRLVELALKGKHPKG